MTACAAELARVDEEIEALGVPATASAATRRVALLYRRACLTGRSAAYRAADREAGAAVVAHSSWPDLWLLKATLDLHFHRFAAARRAVAAVPGLASTPRGRVLLADVDLHVGDIPAARAGFEAAARTDPCADHLVRLAGIEEAAGRYAEAGRLYDRAEDDLTAKEMRSFAWVQLQRGSAACARGLHDEAERLYDRADAAFSGYWLVAAHRAALATARGDAPATIALYEELVRSVRRPEFDHLLGDALVAAGDSNRARTCHDRARARYRASIEAGEVHELHRAAILDLSVYDDAASACEYALADLTLRRSPLSLRTAARCLAAIGRLDEAERLVDEAEALSAPLAAASTS